MRNYPKSIRRENNSLHIAWEDGHKSVLEFSYLRRRCPCVMCKNVSGRASNEGVELPSFQARPVDIVSSSAVGNYAIHFKFNDGHDTGIYSFEHLRKICPCEECLVLL